MEIPIFHEIAFSVSIEYYTYYNFLGLFFEKSIDRMLWPMMGAIVLNVIWSSSVVMDNEKNDAL